MQTFEVGFQLEWRLERKTVNSPCSVAGACHHSPFAKIGEVLRNLRLRETENFLKVADAKRPARQQVDNPESRDVTETLVNLHQIHSSKYCYDHIYVNTYISEPIVERRAQRRPA